MQTTRGAPLTGAESPPDPPHPPGPARRRRLPLLFGVAAIAWGLDALSKALVVAYLEGRPPVDVVDHVFRLVAGRNSGAAFGIGGGATALITAVAIGVVVAIVRTARRLASRWWAVAMGLLLGGALGNLTDRMVRSPGPFRGAVVDWLALPHWPVFNLADTWITTGAVLAVVLSLLAVPLEGRRR